MRCLLFPSMHVERGSLRLAGTPSTASLHFAGNPSYLLDEGSFGLTLKKLQEKVSQWFIVVSGVLINI